MTALPLGMEPGPQPWRGFSSAARDRIGEALERTGPYLPGRDREGALDQITLNAGDYMIGLEASPTEDREARDQLRALAMAVAEANRCFDALDGKATLWLGHAAQDMALSFASIICGGYPWARHWPNGALR